MGVNSKVVKSKKNNIFYILDDFKILSYFTKSDKIKPKKGKPKTDINCRLKYISLTNKFYIIPDDSIKEFNEINISKAVSSNLQKPLIKIIILITLPLNMELN